MRIRNEKMKFERPDRLPEANIQAEFYHQCKIRGIECCLGYRVNSLPHSFKRGKKFCVFDAVIVQREQVVCIIEIKRPYRYRKSGQFKSIKEFEVSMQFKRYSQYDVPLIYIIGFDEIIPAIRMIEELLRGGGRGRRDNCLR